ncbi:MAG: hypothetical protein ABIQ44_06600 [Chloroflexia bacterium]
MNTRRGRRQPLNRKTILKAVLLSLTSIAGLVLIAYVVARFFFVGDSEPPKITTGPASSWQAQLGRARDALSVEESGAVLESVKARALVDGATRADLNADNILAIDFTFVMTSGATTLVSMFDTDPPSNVGVTRNSAIIEAPYTKEEFDALKSNLASIKLSPREALRKTITEGATYSSEKNAPVFPYVTLYLQDELQTKYNTPVAYYVDYLTGQIGLTLLVNPQSGAIIDRRDLVTAQPTTIPAPSPMP